MIKDPTFIRAHLTHTRSFNTQNATHLLLLHTVTGWFKEDLYSLCYDNPAFDQYCNFEFPSALKKVTDDRACRVVGTCNGLVCLADDLGRYVSNLLIWNPSVRKYVTLPNPLGGYGCASFGLGYDSVTNDYKVVRLATQLDLNNKLYECPPVAQVYSLANGSWSSLHFDLPPCLMAGCSPNAFVNGALHWLAFRLMNDAYVYFILSFEVSSGSFRQIMLPESFKLDMSFGLRLSVSGDGKSLGLFAKCDSDSGSFLDIWVMREHCMEKPWTKMMILSPQGPKRSLHQALCFRKSGEVVLVLEDDRELVSLDLVSKKFKSLGISGGQLCSVDSYEESLVLLDREDASSY